jgi:hypothetical protein
LGIILLEKKILKTFLLYKSVQVSDPKGAAGLTLGAFFEDQKVIQHALNIVVSEKRNFKDFIFKVYF